MLFVLVFIINVLTTLPLLALFKPSTFTKYALGFFILFCTELILIGNILGLIGWINKPTAWITGQGMLLVGCWFFWLKKGKPAIFLKVNLPSKIRQFRSFEKIVLIICSIVLLACFSILIYLILVVPPNNTDSMVVHLARVGYWMQHGSFKPWDALIERQVVYPYNAPILLLWLTLFSRSDLLTPFLQFFAALFSAVSIYGLCRLLQTKRFFALMTGFLYLTFPQVILQATTTQNDLIIACFIGAGSFFLLDWIKDQRSGYSSLFMASISLAISLGIKATSYYYFIGLLVSLLLLLLIKKLSIKKMLHFAVVLFAAFILLSSTGYAINQIHFGTPLGPASFLQSESGLQTEGSLFDKIKVNGMRFIYQLVSLDGFPFKAQQDFNQTKAGIAAKYPDLFDTSLKYIKDPNDELFTLETDVKINEDLTWFGPVFALLLLPGLVAGIVRVIKHKDICALTLIVIGILYTAAVTVLRPGWDPYQGRYLNAAVVILMPLIGLLFTRNIFSKILLSLAVVVSLIPLTFTTLVNDSKPILTQSILKTECHKNIVTELECDLVGVLPRSIFLENLPSKMAITRINSRTGRLTYTHVTQKNVLDYAYNLPADSSITLILGNGDWEYPFFGKAFQYRLYPVTHPEEFTDSDWDKLQSGWLIINKKGYPDLIIGSAFELETVLPDDTGYSDWQIYRKSQ